MIKAKVLDKKSRNSSPSLTQRLRGGSSTEKYASNALFLSLNERQVDGEGIQHRFGSLTKCVDNVIPNDVVGLVASESTRTLCSLSTWLEKMHLFQEKSFSTLLSLPCDHD